MLGVKMDPITIILLVALFGGGVATGVAVKSNGAAKVAKEQREAIAEVAKGQKELMDAVTSSQSVVIEGLNRPIELDAELRATLTQIPPQCLSDLGGNPLSVQCQWAMCAVYGQSDRNRPECGPIVALLVEELKTK